MGADAEVLDRKSAVPALIGDPADFLIIGGLAGTARDIAHLTGDGDNAFLLGGAMGAAVSVGLGLALTQPGRRVLVATGDGELLMGLGALGTVGVMAPANLSILCVDNGHYQETGGQPSHTSLGVDLAAIAQGCGIPNIHGVATSDEIGAAAMALRAANGPVFVLLKVGMAAPPATRRSFDAAARKSAFRQALLGAP
ncbi:MAG: thiamine pyrophosphate-dependent enzyme [Alphaproteobacteria bacterium]|jgi:phosphonopyruvate decarboxylase|nr:thiamine pyrophosphate-dependent enzyme [Alphaproteobacteria bacterium]